MKKGRKFEQHACQFKNEADCEEEVEEDGLELDDVEEEYFSDD